MDNTDLMVRLLTGQGHGQPLSARLMNESIIPRQPGNELTVRALLGDKSVMSEGLGYGTPNQPSQPSVSTDQSVPLWARFFPNPSTGDKISLAMSLFGGPGRQLRSQSVHLSPEFTSRVEPPGVSPMSGAQSSGGSSATTRITDSYTGQEVGGFGINPYTSQSSPLVTGQPSPGLMYQMLNRLNSGGDRYRLETLPPPVSF